MTLTITALGDGANQLRTALVLYFSMADRLVQMLALDAVVAAGQVSSALEWSPASNFGTYLILVSPKLVVFNNAKCAESYIYLSESYPHDL